MHRFLVHSFAVLLAVLIREAAARLSVLVNALALCAAFDRAACVPRRTQGLIELERAPFDRVTCTDSTLGVAELVHRILAALFYVVEAETEWCNQ